MGAAPPLRTNVIAWRLVLAAAILGSVLAGLSLGGAAAGAGPAFTYRPIAAVPIGTTEAQSVVLGDKLYLFGGFDVWKPCCTPTNRAWSYDPATDRWSALPAMPGRGVSHGGIDSDGSRYIYYAGGYAANSTGTNQVYGTIDVFRYDVQTQTYAAMPSLPQARAAGGLADVGGALYYFGGANLPRTQDSPDVWELDLTHGAQSWVSLAPMPNPRNHLGWAVIGGSIYVVGGQHLSDSRTAQGELDRFDVATDTWTALPSMPLPRSHLMDSTYVQGGRLVTAGGWTTTNVSAAVLAYDPASATWSSLPNLPEARTSTTVKGISGGRLIFCCGSAGSSPATGWIGTPAVGAAPLPSAAPSVTPTPAPPVAAVPQPPAGASQPQVTPPARTPIRQLLSVALRPSTVRAAQAGAAQVSFRLRASARVTLALQRCRKHTCTSLDRRTVVSPAGRSHVSVRFLTGRRTLAAGHYRFLVALPKLKPVTLHLLVQNR